MLVVVWLLVVGGIGSCVCLVMCIMLSVVCIVWWVGWLMLFCRLKWNSSVLLSCLFICVL